MPVKMELLEILGCPKCKGDLEYEEAAEELRCSACRLRYQVEDDIPVMFPERALKFEE